MTLSFISTSSLITSQKSQSPATTEVVIVRHGRSNYNEQGIHQGASDGSVLTLKGREAAYKTGLALRDFQFDAIYTSPLQRVRQTTEEILRAFQELGELSYPIWVDHRLTEINMACWEGLTYQKVREDFAENYATWKQTPHLFSFESATGEPYFPLQELYQQSQQFWQEILVKHCGHRILVVAHGGTNRTLISSAVGLGPEHYHQFQQSNTCINWLEFPVSGRSIGKLKWLNSTRHLQENLPKLKEGKHGWRWVLISNQIQQLQALQDCLSQESIGMLLSDDSSPSENIASSWCKACPSTVHLSVKQSNFLETWQQTIMTQQKSNNSVDSGLTTSLIVATPQLLNQVIARFFPQSSITDLENQFSVIHYPKNHHPILQGLIPIHSISKYAALL